MQIHIQKWGNSLGLRIPMKFSHQLNLKSGSPVDIKIEKDHLIIYPKKYYLEDMLSRITEENCHYEAFTNESKGCEEW
jgi:antitoxin MazE